MAATIGDKVKTFFCGPLHISKDGDEKTKNLTNASQFFRTTLTVLAILASLAAVLGALSYFGVMSIGVNALGTLGANPAFWMFVGCTIGAVAIASLGIAREGVQYKRSAPAVTV